MAARSVSYGGGLVALAAAAGVALSLYAYFLRASIAGSVGLLIVIGTTAVMLVAALVLAGLPRLPRWLRALLWFGVVVDALGTGFAAWLLELDLLIAFMGVVLLCWLLHLLSGGRSAAPARPAHA